MTTPARKLVLSVGLAAMFATAPTLANDKKVDPDLLDPFMDQEKRDLIERLVRNGLDNLTKAVEEIVDAFPRYDIPEITPDGDIIMRRRHPESETAREIPSTSGISI